jgi:hypothetical protein
MKCNDVHNGLDKAEIRTFLAKQIGYGYDGEVEHIEGAITKLQGELVAAKASRAVMQLIKLNGWDEFDFSDYVSDYKKGVYFPFVGTAKEAGELENYISQGDSK